MTYKEKDRVIFFLKEDWTNYTPVFKGTISKKVRKWLGGSDYYILVNDFIGSKEETRVCKVKGNQIVKVLD